MIPRDGERTGCCSWQQHCSKALMKLCSTRLNLYTMYCHNKQPQDSPRNWSIFLLSSGVICKNNSKNKGIIQVKGKKLNSSIKGTTGTEILSGAKALQPQCSLFNKVEMEQLKINPTHQTPSICRGDVSHQTKFKIYCLSRREQRQLLDRN